MPLKRLKGFTLAEILICLLILGEIAVFTLPKILVVQQNQRYNATSKEAISAISEAYMLHKMTNGISSSTRFADITQYLNYVALDLLSVIDDQHAGGTVSCSGMAYGGCLVLHNGARLRYNGSMLNGTTTLNALDVWFDPDGTSDGTTNGPGKSVHFFIYADGKIRTRGSVEANTVNSGQTWASPNTNFDPPWFSW